MRTAIFLGLLYIGDAIGTPSYAVSGSNSAILYSIAFVVFAIMDIIDFVHKS